ncbi:glycoside hydrolase TIM-barrel-like domain-containing protein [Tateyamaria omphalii]|uniref:baseplate multidomain protein megatron n=1 Tax=Tateyamaria omphalii TaxID=299262 RepID=UPI001C995F90|nr:glycoside hydrolase TIM-barrel-like domain-containing protein [Tateyamaria omphalii]MBY5932958.1 glycoside hydrolase TIM-barrel-like domain-containing protein [Tateyamaria omphalii]
MATVVLSAAGAAIGGSVGGSFLGLSSVAIGRAVGATLGRVIDQRVMGQGSEVVEHGKVDRFRLSNSGEGAPVTQLYGRMRLGGQVIWSSDFLETVTVTGGGGGGGGKGAPSAPPEPERREYSYSVSLALAVCEGEITRIGRVWADGEEVALNDINMRVYTGSKDQLPDPLIEAIEGQGLVPAYRGTAYVVIENLALGRFGNRVPQFSFEVVRPEQAGEAGADEEMTRAIQAVAIMPGTGEYTLATTPVNYLDGNNARWSANINTPAGLTDFTVSLDALQTELPNCGAASLIVSWFGSDLRCGQCRIRPKVERWNTDGENMRWSVSSLVRTAAYDVPRIDDRPIYGGTPSDKSVVESIRALVQAGKKVMFYPFILMDQLEGNTLPNPYNPDESQPHLPWRGRITLSTAPGVEGSPDGTSAAEAEIDAFFGTVQAADFSIDSEIHYSGPDEWTLSRFILHYATLCRAAGGVDSFCISSEMRGLTQIRGTQNRFYAVEKLRALAAQVRLLLGPDVKISYAADWTEYFGYQPQDGSGDRYFHLDPLWSDDNIDFIGIDNYMPISDWRDGDEHTDAEWGSIYNLDYLRANIEGGEGYDWYYASDEASVAQMRTAITDGAHDEPWMFRFKDLRNWWSNAHYERIGGERSQMPTDWVPQSKPIWFTELGCAAVDKGTNQPNKFLDRKSSESSLPRYSNGGRDDLIQKQYLRAMHSHWRAPENNPISDEYAGPMIDMSRAFVWAWDARPYPFFPNSLRIWSDGENYPRGHWINGRTSGRSLASVVGEICQRSGLTHYDTSELYGFVRGYTVEDVTDARSALQPLMLRFAFDAVERDGVLKFITRTGRNAVKLTSDALALHTDLNGRLEQSRESEADIAGRVRLRFVQTDGNFDVLAEEAVLADEATHAVSISEVAMALTRPEGRQVAERWLAEARIAREGVKLALPPSLIGVGAGDVIEVAADGSEGPGLYRVDRVEHGEMQLLEAVRIEPEVYTPSELSDELAGVREFVPPVPLTSVFMDLPLLTGDEVEHAPHLAVTGTPWPGGVAVYQSSTESDFVLNSIIAARASIGFLNQPLLGARSGVIDRGEPLDVRMVHGTLQSIPETTFLNGGNLVAIGDGSADNWELLQFRDAELIAQNQYLLSHRLRGQAGTDALMPDEWPIGSWFVLMNGVPSQIGLLRALRRISQTFRIGPAKRSYDDPSYTEAIHAFNGNGLRPYSPVHLTMSGDADGVTAHWVRRTRLDGDDWELPDVPLAEEIESYTVRVVQADQVVRETTTASPSWSYTNAMQQADGVAGPFSISVAQNSARYGPGPFKSAVWQG